jgi:ABC-type antimicrobial peptide transport system permease subunit
VLSICGGLALLVATAGLAAVVMHAVSRRIREFGVRVSVGATPGDLLAHVLRESAALLAPGLAVGLLLAVGLARIAQAALIGVDVTSPLTYAAVAALQAIVVTLACLGPALRAARLDPVDALRSN